MFKFIIYSVKFSHSVAEREKHREREREGEIDIESECVCVCMLSGLGWPICWPIDCWHLLT